MDTDSEFAPGPETEISEVSADEPSKKCPTCQQLRETASELKRGYKELARLQKTFEPLVKRYELIQRAHPRCALCFIMSGEHHIETVLVPEPLVPRAKGQKRYAVCSDCYKLLHRLRRSVPQQRAYARHVWELDKDEDNEIVLPGEDNNEVED
jgi:hypothetical protein